MAFNKNMKALVAVGLALVFACAMGVAAVAYAADLESQGTAGDLKSATVAMQAQASSSEAKSFKSDLKKVTSEPVRYFKYTNTSKTQAMAITGGTDNYGGVKAGTVWFVKNGNPQWLYTSTMAFYKGETHLYSVKGGKIFKVEQGAYGSGSSSYAWFVSGGEALQLPQIGSGMTQVKGNRFSVVRGAFDSMCSNGTWYGHTYNSYYYRWNGKKFIEYGGKSMTQKQFKKAKNGKSVLRAIKKQGTVKSIYYRANGIVNVNYAYTSNGVLHHSNVKLKYSSSANKYSYVKVWQNLSGALAAATEGGWYSARGGSSSGDIGVSYPKQLPKKLR